MSVLKKENMQERNIQRIKIKANSFRMKNLIYIVLSNHVFGLKDVQTDIDVTE